MMMMNMVGFRFRPTDEELVGFFLDKKVKGQLPVNYSSTVYESNLYEEEPWTIWNKFGGSKLEELQGDEETDLYFFTKLKKKTPKGSRISRKVGSDGNGATWSGDSSEVVYAKGTKNPIGLKRNFHYEKAGSKHHGGWLMHEYSLNIKNNNMAMILDHDYVLCRLRRKIKIEKKRKLSKTTNSDINDDDQEKKRSRCSSKGMASSNINIGNCEINEEQAAGSSINNLISMLPTSDSDHQDNNEMMEELRHQLLNTDDQQTDDDYCIVDEVMKLLDSDDMDNYGQEQAAGSCSSNPISMLPTSDSENLDNYELIEELRHQLLNSDDLLQDDHQDIDDVYCMPVDEFMKILDSADTDNYGQEQAASSCSNNNIISMLPTSDSEDLDNYELTQTDLQLLQNQLLFDNNDQHVDDQLMINTSDADDYVNGSGDDQYSSLLMSQSAAAAAEVVRDVATEDGDHIPSWLRSLITADDDDHTPSYLRSFADHELLPDGEVEDFFVKYSL